MESAGHGRLLDGRYRLAAVIGRGGMGVVWRARDEILSRDVAVKEVVWPAYFSEAEQQAVCRRAGREGKLAARLNHRNVVRVFDIVEEDGRPWLVMELLPYRSLRELVKEEGPLSPVRAARTGLEILAALRAAHAEGIVHRDVKPANILVAPDRMVLTDFGIARPAGMSAVTTVGMLVGSPSYIAPERARTGQSGPAGDLWGLGASLYAAVEGHGPFDRDGGALASLTAVVADEPPPAAHAGPLLWPVISGLLRKDPDTRMDAEEAEPLLRRAAGEPVAPAGVPANPVSLITPRSRRAQGRTAALIGSAALAGLAVSGTVVGLAHTSSPRSGSAAVATIAPGAGSARTPAASTPPKASTRTPPNARTPQAQAPHSPAPRNAAAATSSRTGNTAASFTAEKAGPGSAHRRRFTGRPGRFTVPVRHRGRHADHGPDGPGPVDRHPAPPPGRAREH